MKENTNMAKITTMKDAKARAAAYVQGCYEHKLTLAKCSDELKELGQTASDLWDYLKPIDDAGNTAAIEAEFKDENGGTHPAVVTLKPSTTVVLGAKSDAKAAEWLKANDFAVFTQTKVAPIKAAIKAKLEEDPAFFNGSGFKLDKDPKLSLSFTDGVAVEAYGAK